MVGDEAPKPLSDDDLADVHGGTGREADAAAANAGLSGQDFAGASLDTVMMMVNMDRANVLDQQVRAMASDIKARNDTLGEFSEGYSVLIDVRAAAGQDGGVPLDTKVTFRNEESTLGEVANRLGLDTGALKDGSLSPAELAAGIESTKNKIDGMTAESQLSMIQLQSMMSTYNQTTENLPNWLSKDAQLKTAIEGNLR